MSTSQLDRKNPRFWCGVICSFVLCSTAFGQAPPPFASREAALPDTFIDTPIGFADVNGDGVPDLVLRQFPFVYLNDGSGHLNPVAASGGPVGFAVSVAALADLDADGHADLVTFNGGAVTVFFGTSSGGFSAGVLLTSGIGAVVSITIGDINGDHAPDLILGILNLVFTPTPVLTPGNTVVYLNNGAGAFTAAGSLGLPMLGNDALVLTDLDQDGDLDLLVSGPAGLGMIFNQGGTFGGAVNVVAGTAAAPPPIRVARLNADNYADYVVSLPGGLLALYAGGPSGPVLLGAPQPSPLTLVGDPIDVNRDGIDEVLGFAGDGITALFVGSGGALTPALHQSCVGSALFVVDLDGDSDLDLVINYNTGANTVFFADATGGFHFQGPAPQPRPLLGGPVVFDATGDGVPDLVGIAVEAGVVKLAVAVNDGVGRFGWASVPITGVVLPTHPYVLAAADLDGDGDRDLVAFQLTPLTTQTWSIAARRILNQGGGVWVASGPTTVASAASCDVAVADLNGDGREDVAFSDPLNGVRVILATAGGGLNLPGTVISAGSAASIAVADVDADGDPDIVVAGSPSRLLVNQGGLVFTPDPAFPTVSASYCSIGDVNGDGVPDAYLDGTPEIHQGVGWTPAATVPSGSVFGFVGETRTFDFDGDGDLDTLTGFGRVYVTDIGGVVRTYQLAVNLGMGLRYLPVDLDRDGDLDLVGTAPVFPPSAMPAFGQVPVVMFNTARQLTVDTLARPARPMHTGLHGLPGGNWFLFVANGLGNAPLPPYGTVLIDPASAAMVTGGTFDNVGSADLLVYVPPPFAGLLGVEFDVQGLVDTVAGPRLTNARRIVIVGW